jgi:hypothetical protein
MYRAQQMQRSQLIGILHAQNIRKEEREKQKEKETQGNQGRQKEGKRPLKGHRLCNFRLHSVQ